MTYQIEINRLESVVRVDHVEDSFPSKDEYLTAKDAARGKEFVRGRVVCLESNESRGFDSPDIEPAKIKEGVDGILYLLSKCISERELGEHQTSNILVLDTLICQTP